MNIPRKALYAAAQAKRKYETNGACDLGRACELCDCPRQTYTIAHWREENARALDEAAHILEAAAPFIAAEAWRVGVRDGERNAALGTSTPNPYEEGTK